MLVRMLSLLGFTDVELLKGHVHAPCGSRAFLIWDWADDA